MPAVPQRLAAAVVLNEQGKKLLAEYGAFRFSRKLRKEMAASYEAAFIPKLWRFLEKLPTNKMGKTNDANIINLFAGKI